MPSNNKKTSDRSAGILVKLRRVFGLNIGTMLFGALFLYMVFSAILYLTSAHIESYQVTSGPLSKNETYTGLAIREENVVKADSGGYVAYYAREGSKINAGGAVYGLSSTKTPEIQTKLSQEELARIRSDMLSFSKGFNPSKFNSTYSFKYQLEGNILQYAGVTAEPTVPVLFGDETADIGSDSQAGVVTLGNQTISKAKSDGIVLYSMDGYEGKTAANITAEDFDQNSYHETDLKTQNTVNAGENIYTLITDERWSLLIPLSSKQAAKLADRTSIRVKFLKDDMTQSGSFSILEIDGVKYGKIDFSRGLIRYASDRFLEIELVTNTTSGLKIPLSSIVTKEFYTIPSEFVSRSEDGNSSGFFMADKNKEGKDIKTFVSPTVYAIIEDDTAQIDESNPDAKKPSTYYVDKSAFKEGNAIIKDGGSSGKYIVGETGVLEGVYCTNPGYAVFRRIEILDQNEEYAIVSQNTSYGLVRYDHIVRNADEVKEQDILY